MGHVTSDAALHETLSGPIASVRLPFTADGQIDTGGLHAYVERCVAGPAGVVMLTYGDSLYSVLTDDEVVDVTRAAIDQVAGRCAVIAADRSWWTGKAVEFAGFCREAGADLLMVLPPDWTTSGTPESLADYYAAISAQMPVMMVTNYLKARSLEEAGRVVDEVARRAPGVIAVKEDVGGERGRDLTARLAGRMTVVAGGTKRLHADLRPHGAAGYLSTLAVFRPDLATAYWDAVQSDDDTRMRELIDTADVPLFRMLAGFPGGFDAALHGWCELAGIAGRWRRGPYHSLTDTELDGLAQALDELGLRHP